MAKSLTSYSSVCSSIDINMQPTALKKELWSVGKRSRKGNSGKNSVSQVEGSAKEHSRSEQQ